jgi:2-polyprenyl-6-methoxyphenol hydroxylase-like FAD-dependent oxidoreductase
MKKTYRLDKKTMKLVEVVKEPPSSKSTKYISDSHYDGLRATDGTDIGSRTKHREYMKKHGLTTADDYSSSWAKAKEAREQYFQRGGTITRADILNVIKRLENK